MPLLGWIMGEGKERFHLLLEKRIASAGTFHKGGSLKCIVTFDGIGQDRLHLLPAL